MSLTKKAIGGSIHRIREFELEKVNLIDEFDILQIVGEGWFGKILLTEHRSTQTEMVLKALPKAYTGITDFFREFHYGLHLAAHRNIITTYDVAFETAGFYVFSQEYAPLGDLTSNVTETGLGELHAKRVARQLAAAVHHIHSRELVHRDIKLDNVLVFRSDFSRIKLCDFGETRRVNTVVRRHNEWLPYSPPEVLQIDTDVTYKALTSHDVWQFGIVLFVCLTGCLPWQKAALDDPRYTRYQNWHNATLNIAKKPKLFQLISSRAQRMFKRLLDPKAEKRPVSVLEVNKYLEDRWLAKLGAEKALNGGADERDELCPSMYSFHSSLEEKNQLLHTLTTYGIETTVDRTKKKDRIRQWIQSSAIMEEYEEEGGEEESSDINDEARYHEDEDEEPTSMKGRHFPEARPSAKTNDVKKRSRANTSSARKRQSIKPAERKIPFAPQVAEERETIARFASFPNGDPNLAFSRNGTNGTVNSRSVAPYTGALVEVNAETGVEDASANGKPGNNTSTSGVAFSESSLAVEPETEIRGSRGDDRGGTIDKIALGEETADDRGTPKSPQIPMRKHRSQTAPFPVPVVSPEANGSGAKSTKRSQSASGLPTTPRERSVLSAVRKEGSPVTILPTRADSQSSTNPSMGGRTERSPTVVATTAPSSVARAENRSASTAAIARTERLNAQTQSMSRVENQSSVMLPVARVENQLSNTLPITRNEKSPSVAIQLPTANPLTMSVASHLVMQSFNALQGMNTAQSAPSTSETTTTTTTTLDPSPGIASNLESTPRSSPTTTPARTSTPKNSPTATPVRTLTPKVSPTSTPSRNVPTSTPRIKANQRTEDIVTYGKDAYEHYGIAQGAILRAGGLRNGSTGSGSRSVSN